jgi:hypothetical protein
MKPVKVILMCFWFLRNKPESYNRGNGHPETGHFSQRYSVI